MVATPTSLSRGSQKLQTSKMMKLFLQQLCKKLSSSLTGAECRKLKFGLATFQQICDVRSVPEPKYRHETNKFRTEVSRSEKSRPSEMSKTETRIGWFPVLKLGPDFLSRTGIASVDEAPASEALG